MARICSILHVSYDGRGVKDDSALRMKLPPAEIKKTGRGASLEKGKSQTLTGGMSSVKCLLSIKLYVL